MLDFSHLLAIYFQMDNSEMLCYEKFELLSYLESIILKEWNRNSYCRAVTDFMPKIYHVSCLPLIYEEMALEMYIF